MPLYLDTADRAAIERFLSTGLFTGVTTNPIILRTAGLDPSRAGEVYRCAVDAGAREVFFQTFGGLVEDQVEQGLRYRELGPEVVIKVVASPVGATACAALSKKGVPTLLTALHSARQTLIAIAAGAQYIAAYLPEMNAAGMDALAEISTMQQILTASGAGTKLMLAGVGDTATVVRLAVEGVTCVTMRPSLADQMLTNELTMKAAEMFEAASVAMPHDA
jgi:transaldolase